MTREPTNCLKIHEMTGILRKLLGVRFLAQRLLRLVIAMKPWFLILLIGTLSGFVVLRTALADSDDLGSRYGRSVAQGDGTND